MKRKLNKWLSGVLAACVLFTTVPVYAINDVSGTETSTEVVETSEETQSSEIETSSTEETNQESSESAESSETTSEEDSKVENTNTESIENTIETSSEEQTSEIVDEMLNISPMNLGDEEEPSTDNWELSTVFYDSTVDNGKTPLTSIDWDASDGGYREGTPRVITVQINYRNSNAVTTYQPGDINLKITNLIYDINNESSTANLTNGAKITANLNDKYHSGFFWSYEDGTDDISYDYWSKDILFTNAETIEAKENFEGSINIAYEITPQKETPEKYEDSCFHYLDRTIKATIDDVITSNKIDFHYERTYSHEWQKTTTKFSETAEKVSSLDGFGSDAKDYIWVKYKLSPYGTNWLDKNAIYPYQNIYNAVIYSDIPAECKVYDTRGNRLQQINGSYDFLGETFYNETRPDSTTYSSSGGKIIYVGYPKSIYNEENDNLVITNTSYLYGKYLGEEDGDYQYLNTASTTVNLNEFDFSYNGELYSISKTRNGFSTLRYQDIINNWTYNSSSWNIHPTVIYSGEKVTVKIGDDLLYATNKEGNYEKLNDDDYCFTWLRLFDFRNGHGDRIQEGKYNCELWVRYANQSDYTLYETFKNGYGGNKTSYSPQGDGVWSFDESQEIVGYYLIIYDLEESLVPSSSGSTSLVNEVKFLKEDIPESGQLYNFAYMQSFIRDKDNNLILQNEPDIDSYNSFITKEEIANYDKQTYGTYMQRSYYSTNWEYYHVPEWYTSIKATPYSNRNLTQDEQKEEFTGAFYFGGSFLTDNSRDFESNYFYDYDDECFVNGLITYDLLPEGFNILSTEEEILNDSSYILEKRKTSDYLYNEKSNSDFKYFHIYDKNKNELSPKEFYELVKESTTITILKNWKGTNRTLVKAVTDFADNPLLITEDATGEPDLGPVFKIKFSIPYDSYLEFGSTFTNEVYAEFIEPTKNHSISMSQLDIIDINENNKTDDYISKDVMNIQVNPVSSTHQSVQTQASSSFNTYSTELTNTTYGGNYSYKLKVRTGLNSITNLIIYDNIEKWTKDKDGNFIESYGKKKYWQGEFLGIDTSYAESKGYNVKVWYSENERAGTLTEDTSWKEYSDTVDKTKIKSLAFQYCRLPA